MLVLLLSGEGTSRHLCFVSSMCEKLAWVHRFLHLTLSFKRSDSLPIDNQSAFFLFWFSVM